MSLRPFDTAPSAPLRASVFNNTLVVSDFSDLNLLKGRKIVLNHTSGFSLIELIICIALILLITTITMPNLWFLKQQQVAVEAEKLHMAFMYMQQLAINKNQNLHLIFDEKNKSYTYENKIEVLPQGVEFGFIEGVKGPPAIPNKLINSAISFLGKKITFFSTGVIQPGTVYLIDSYKKYFYAITISVSQVSFVRKYKWDGKWNAQS